MTKHNKHIEDYLDYYLDSKFNPEFAVLLQGEWGCGKTWFIKNYLKKYFKEEKSKYLYITLYGVAQINEIEDQMFQQLHPLLSSKPLVFTGKILSGVLKDRLKIDLNDKKLNKFMINIKDPLIIFDDFERSAMDMKILMGYINSFVEHQQLKVIILANEEELKAIEKKEAKDDSTLYTKIKEKLIGKTFKINHDTESAFESFVKQVEKRKIKVFINGRKREIIDIFNTAKYRNLRHLKQSLWDFERFYHSIPEKYLLIHGLMDELLNLFLAFSFEVKKGQILPTDINQLESFYYRHAREIMTPTNNNDEPKRLPIDTVIEKYSFINSHDTILPGSLWCNLFDKGYISEDDIIASLEKSKYCIEKNTPAWVKLWHFRDLNDNEFPKLLEEVNKEWKVRKFETPGEILHVSGLFLNLTSIGLIDKNIVDVVADCKTYIDDVKKKGFLHKYVGIHKHGMDKISSNGLGYAGINLKEFQTINDYLNEAISNSKMECLPKEGEELLKVLLNNPREFGQKIFDQTYYDIPIFKFIKPEDFFKIFLELDYGGKSIVLGAMENRYEFQKMDSKLHEEIDFFKNLNLLIVKRVSEKKGNINGYILNEFLPDFTKIENKLKSLKVDGNEETSK